MSPRALLAMDTVMINPGFTEDLLAKTTEPRLVAGNGQDSMHRAKIVLHFSVINSSRRSRAILYRGQRNSGAGLTFNRKIKWNLKLTSH
jgi:hypothetical protein